MNLNLTWRLIPLLVLVLGTSPLTAAEAPLQLKAKRIVANPSQDTISYVGDVNIRQKDWQLTGNRAVVTGSTNKGRQVNVTGNPVTVTVTRTSDGKSVTLTGRRVTYLVRERLLTVSGEARLTGPDTSLAAEEIHYRLNDRHMTAGNQNPQQRVSVRLNADALPVELKEGS